MILITIIIAIVDGSDHPLPPPPNMTGNGTSQKGREFKKVVQAVLYSDFEPETKYFHILLIGYAHFLFLIFKKVISFSLNLFNMDQYSEFYHNFRSAQILGEKVHKDRFIAKKHFLKMFWNPHYADPVPTFL